MLNKEQIQEILDNWSVFLEANSDVSQPDDTYKALHRPFSELSGGFKVWLRPRWQKMLAARTERTEPLVVVDEAPMEPEVPIYEREGRKILWDRKLAQPGDEYEPKEVLGCVDFQRRVVWVLDMETRDSICDTNPEESELNNFEWREQA